MHDLERISEQVRADFESRSRARDEALNRARELVRLCATAIRASHRNEWENARQSLEQADAIGQELMTMLAPYPDLFYAGYVQDGLKELVEAHTTLALAQNLSLPTPEALRVPYATYLNGLCEAASEMRRRCLDELRRGSITEAERLLEAMEEIFDMLVTFDFNDAITGGLRHRVDQLRGVLERTRGDLTNSVCQAQLAEALQRFERRLQAG